MAIFSVTFTDSGVGIPTYQQIFDSLKADYQATFATGDDAEPLDLDVTSPDGMAVALWARQLRRAFEVVQSAGAQVYVGSATGTYLDRLANLRGLTRADGESDEELRARILAATTTGLATYDGMLTYLRDKLGADVEISLNETDELVAGNEVSAEKDGSSLYWSIDRLPAHSFAVFAPLPDDYTEDDEDAAAQAIWDCKPAGIEAHAHNYLDRYHVGTAVDADGGEHEVAFYATDYVTVTLAVTVTSYDAAEWTDEADLLEAVVSAVTAKAEELIADDPHTFSGWAALATVYTIGVYKATIEVTTSETILSGTIDGETTTVTSTNSDGVVTARTGTTIKLGEVTAEVGTTTSTEAT